MRSAKSEDRRFRNMADHAPVMMWGHRPGGQLHPISPCHGTCSRANARVTGLVRRDPPWTTGAAERIFLESQWGCAVSLRVPVMSMAWHRWAIDAASPRFGHGDEFPGHVGSVIDDIDEYAPHGGVTRCDTRRFWLRGMEAVPGVVYAKGSRRTGCWPPTGGHGRAGRQAVIADHRSDRSRVRRLTGGRNRGQRSADHGRERCRGRRGGHISLPDGTCAIITDRAVSRCRRTPGWWGTDKHSGKRAEEALGI
jgi:hypothetical protein